MKITAVKTKTYLYPYKEGEEFANGIRWNRARSCVLVIVETDEGITGYGESDSAGAPPEVTACIVEKYIGPLVIGMDPMCVEAVWSHVYSHCDKNGRRGMAIAALSGVDIALWDIMGKALGQPVYRLLGGAHDRLEAYHSGGFYHVHDDPAAEAERGLAANYRSFKMKMGRLSLRDEIKRIESVRRAIGDGCRLMVDANNAYTKKDAMKLLRPLEDLGVFWFEEPVSTDLPEDSAEIARSTSVAIAGYETEHTAFGFRRIIECGAVDIVQCDAIRAGGITELRKIAAISQAWGKMCTGHIFSSGLSLLANMHFIAGHAVCSLLECEANPNPLRTEMFKDYRLTVESDGFVSLPQKPGLGAEIDFDAIEHWRIQ